MKNSKKAFTLVELIAVIAILAILMILLVPSITNVAKNSRISLRDSKIQTIVTAAEDYGNDLINDYQGCLGSTSSEVLKSTCVVSLGDLVRTGYMDAEKETGNIVDPTTNEAFTGDVLLCYDPAHVNVYASYVEDDNYSCRAISINGNNTLALSSAGGVGYVGGNDLEINIIGGGKYDCRSDDDDYATCSVEGDRLKISPTKNRSVAFGSDEYKTVNITVLGEYSDGEGGTENLEKVYSMRVYPTSLEVVDGKACVPAGTSSQIELKVLNTGTMTVESSDKDIMEGTARDGMLYLSAKQKTGTTKLTLKEANGNNEVEIEKKIYKLNLAEDFPENMIVHKSIDVGIEHSGAGNIHIYALENPGVVSFSSATSESADEITLTDESTFTIFSNRMGTTKIVIEGENCGREVRELTVSNLTFKGDARGLIYIGSGPADVEFEVEDSENIGCTSSNPAAATCSVHGTAIQIVPGTVPANDVVLTVGNDSVGYAVYHLTVVKTSIEIIDSEGRKAETVCRDINEDRNNIQVFARGTNWGDTSTYDIEDWYLADVNVEMSGERRSISVAPRNLMEANSPYNVGKNTGRTRIDVKESNGLQVGSFYYNIYNMNLSSSSASMKVDDTVEFTVDASATGEVSVTTSNRDVATAEIVETSMFNWTPNAVNRRKIRVTAVGTGAATISVRGANCGVKTFNVMVAGKSLSLRLSPGPYVTSLGSEMVSCETKGKDRSCSVTFPRINTTSEFQVLGYSKDRNSKVAEYKVGDKFTINKDSDGSTYYGIVADTTKPVCSIPLNVAGREGGETTYFTMTCVDGGSGIKGAGTLSESDFTISNENLGELVEVGSPVAIDGGYSYRLGIKSKQAGLFNLSLKANAVYDNFDNGNVATNLKSIFASEYDVQDYYYVGKSDRNAVIGVLYDNADVGVGAEGTHSLYVYGSGDMLDFLSAEYGDYAPWYNDYKSTITNVVINNGVTNVGSHFVYNSTNLKTVTIPEGITYIGDSAFANANLSSISIPNSVERIEGNAFYGNKNLSNISLGSGVTSIGMSAFYNHKLASLSIPASVRTIGESAFAVEAERSVLANLSFQAGSVLTSIGNSAFIYHKLTSLNIPGTVTTIGNRAFEQVDVSSGTLKTVTFTEDATLSTIGNDAFANASLTSLSLPSSLEIIGARAFMALRDGVTTITLGKNVRSIGNNFAYGKDLASIEVDSENAYYTSENGVLYNKNKTTLVKCPDDYYVANATLDVPSSVRTLQAGSFDGWLNYGTNLKGLVVNLPPGLTNMNIDDNFLSYATAEINISGNANYESVDGVLFNKAKTTAIRLPLAFDSSAYTIPETVTSISDYFSYGQTRVKAITVPEAVTRVGSYAFMADTNYGFATINLNSPEAVTFDESSFAVMAYPDGDSVSSRARTINVKTVNLKSRIESVYDGVPYTLTVNKV